MSDVALSWRPTPTGLVAGGMVVAGLALCGVSWWFFLLVAVGTFGPGTLRELGWLEDKDEFQRRADQRAGYHAFLGVGIAACVLVAFFRSGARAVGNVEELATLLLSLVIAVWLFSSLFAYWGAQKTASRILLGFGCAWLAFTVVSNVGAEWQGWAPLLLHPLLTLPFFALAWLSRRLPRLAGVLLLGAAVFFFLFFGMHRAGEQRLITTGVTFILFVGPLLGSGIALLGAGTAADDPDEDPDEHPDEHHED